MCPVFLRWGRWWIGRQRSRRGGSWLLRRCRSDCRRCGDRGGGTHGSVQSPIIVIWIIVERVGLLQIFFVGESARLSRRHFPARLPITKISHINSNSTCFQLFWAFIVQDEAVLAVQVQIEIIKRFRVGAIHFVDSFAHLQYRAEIN